MSKFGNELRVLLAGQGRKGGDFAKSAGILPTHLSVIMKGGQVRKDTAAKIIKAISDDPKVQASLLAAFLQDQCRGPGSNLIEVVVNGEKIASPTFLAHASVSDEALEAVTVLLRLAEERPAFESTIRGLASSLSGVLAEVKPPPKAKKRN